MKQIGIAYTCYKGKFGTPRQPGLVPDSHGFIEMQKEFSNKDFFKGIEQYSHLWIMFEFHLSPKENLKTTVRPPRLGGNETLGLFATRSNFRPNPIGMSLVKFEKLEFGEKTRLYFTNHDLVDGTPVLDIKPYIPYSDSIVDAICPFEAPQKVLKVKFAEGLNVSKDLKQLITDILSLDPRPAYKNEEDDKVYKFEIENNHVEFEVNGNEVLVLKIQELI